MIEVNAVEGGVKVTIKGSLTDIIAEASQIIYAIYEGVDERDHSLGEHYRDFFINNIEEVFAVGDDMHNKSHKSHKSHNRDKSSEHNDTFKSFDEFLDDLSDILNELKSKNNKEEN